MTMPTNFHFDASSYQAPSYGALPKGWYKAVIDASEFKPTKNGGMAIQVTFSIIDGFAKGRKIFARYNVINNNEDTVRIAYEQLGALSHAVGVIRWDTPAQLHNIPLNLRLKVRSQEGYEDSNEPNGYANINDPVKYAEKEAGAPAMGAQAAVANPFGAGAPAQQPAFPGAAPQQPAANPFAQQQQAPVQQQQPVQQPVQQPAPQQGAAAQPWQNAAPQPWDNPAQNAAPQQPVQQAPVQQPVAPEAVQQPWAQQVAQPGQAAAPQQQAQPQQQAEPHPAQAAVPPWQQ